MNKDKLLGTLCYIMRLLGQRQNDGLAQRDRIRRISAQDIERVVNEHPAHLVPPPESDAEHLVYGEIIEVIESIPRKWAVDVILWTAEEGRSDLTLSVTLVDSDGELYGLEIDDLRVL